MTNEQTAFTANELDWLLKVHEAVFDAVEKSETRLVVEVWGKDDSGPVAWIEAHPDDSEATIRFDGPSPPPPTQEHSPEQAPDEREGAGDVA